MAIKQIPSGGDRNLSYIIIDENSKKSAVIDPSYRIGEIIDEIENQCLKVLYIINTHTHHDHIAGNTLVKEKTGAKIVAHRLASIYHDISVDEGDVLDLGEKKLEIIFTPGHYKDHICVLEGENLFTGDTLFIGCIGGTHFMGSSAKDQYQSIFEKLLKLNDKTKIYPGHDYGKAPAATLGSEKKTNPFLLQKTFEDFCWLKEHWEDYKKKHNLT